LELEETINDIHSELNFTQCPIWIHIVSNDHRYRKDAYPSIRRYMDTAAHVDHSDLKITFDCKILNSDLRSVARFKKGCAYPAYDVIAATVATSTRPPPLPHPPPCAQTTWAAWFRTWKHKMKANKQPNNRKHKQTNPTTEKTKQTNPTIDWCLPGRPFGWFGAQGKSTFNWLWSYGGKTCADDICTGPVSHRKKRKKTSSLIDSVLTSQHGFPGCFRWNSSICSRVFSRFAADSQLVRTWLLKAHWTR